MPKNLRTPQQTTNNNKSNTLKQCVWMIHDNIAKPWCTACGVDFQQAELSYIGQLRSTSGCEPDRMLAHLQRRVIDSNSVVDSSTDAANISGISEADWLGPWPLGRPQLLWGGPGALRVSGFGARKRTLSIPATKYNRRAWQPVWTAREATTRTAIVTSEVAAARSLLEDNA